MICPAVTSLTSIPTLSSSTELKSVPKCTKCSYFRALVLAVHPCYSVYPLVFPMDSIFSPFGYPNAVPCISQMPSHTFLTTHPEVSGIYTSTPSTIPVVYVTIFTQLPETELILLICLISACHPAALILSKNISYLISGIIISVSFTAVTFHFSAYKTT